MAKPYSHIHGHPYARPPIDLVFEAPVSGHARRPPLNGDSGGDEYLDSLVAQGPKRSTRLNANSVRLCNNHLVTLNGLDKAMYHVLDDPQELVWLDASCNQIQNIDDVITSFPSLQVGQGIRPSMRFTRMHFMTTALKFCYICSCMHAFHMRQKQPAVHAVLPHTRTPSALDASATRTTHTSGALLAWQSDMAP